MVHLERKQRIKSELTSRFENIEMYEIDYSLAWKLEKWKRLSGNNVCFKYEYVLLLFLSMKCSFN